MKVALIMTTTVDGFTTRSATEDAGWVSEYDKLFFDQKTRAIGTVIMGANTYRVLPEPFEARLNIVMMSTPDETKNIPNVLEFHGEEPRRLLQILEARGIDEVAIIGGSQINASFLEENLVDELYITIATMVFGQGVSLSSGYDLDLQLRLLEIEQIGSDVALLHYEVVK
ncbi:MAG: dihydrofolate reductase [Patescibacteria group bacterium]